MSLTGLTLTIRQIAWWHGSDRKHKPRASGWRDPQGRHYVYMNAADWLKTFPCFGPRHIGPCWRLAVPPAFSTRSAHSNTSTSELTLRS